MFCLISFSQSTEKYFLQGIIYGKNYTNVIGTIYILKDGNSVKIRQEYVNDPADYTLSEAAFKNENQQLIFNQTSFLSKKLGLKNQLCKSTVYLEQEDSLGYWRGTIKSAQCRNMNYEVICYESSLRFNEEPVNNYNNYWIKEFQRRLEKKYPSPKKMEEKRANFKLFTIYFDYDKYDIRPEYISRLNEMTMIIDSHTDYRIKITGHTDADGSDQYNDELSKNRADEIRRFFTARGIPDHKIVIEFKGEKLPVDNNKTSEGKQRNRRVEIGFI